MLRQRDKLLLVGLLIALLAALDLNPKKYEEAPEQRKDEGKDPKKTANHQAMIAPQSEAAQGNRSDRAKRKFWFGYEPIEKFNFLLVLATICLGFIGTIQVWTFIESERPFVGVPGVHIAGDEFKAAVPLHILADLKNSGKTTAFLTDARMLIHWQRPGSVLEHGLTKFLKKSTASGPLLAGDVTEMVFNPTTDSGKPIVFDQAAIDTITNGGVLIFIIGYVSYKDEFPIIGRTSTTGYCYVYNPHPPDSRVSPFARCGNAEYEYAK